MPKLQRPLATLAGAVLAALVMLVASFQGSAAAQAAQRLTVSAQDSALLVSGATSVRPGYVRIRVRNDGRNPHGIELVRLKRPLTTPQLLAAFAAEKHDLLESLGGIQQVAPGRSWEMTQRLAPGSYAFVDFGQNGPKPNYARGLFKRFQIASTRAIGAAPKTVGNIEMREFAYRFRLPKPLTGHGIVKIANAGNAGHEITLVRIEPGHTQDEVLNLIVAGATSPPKWASIVELLSILDPGKTAYVRLDLRPGRYVALSLVNQPGSAKLDAQRGMIGTFEVT